MSATRNRPPRPAFTLVELMVAMALTLGIMWILAESFKMGVDFTRNAHATGELMTQLNGAGNVINRDLQAEHFLPSDTAKNRGVRLGDQRLDKLGPNGNQWSPPAGGYFRIVSPPSVFEGYDSEGLAVNTGTGALQFTAILPGGTDQNVYSTLANGVPYTSRAAEVAYFLVPVGQTAAGPSGRTLYNLIRRQRLVAYSADDQGSLLMAVSDVEPPPASPTVSAVVAGNGSNQVYTLSDLTNPALRMPMAPFAANSQRFGEDVILSNVLSFEVLVEWEPNTAGFTGSTGGPRLFGVFGSGNTDHPCDSLAVQTGSNPSFSGQGVFDTWFQTPKWNVPGTANSVPLAIRVKSIQYTIRVFDPRTKLARQNTWKVSM